MTPNLLIQLAESIQHNRDRAEATIHSMRDDLVALEPPGNNESLVNRIHRRSLLYGIARMDAWMERMDAALDRIHSGTFGTCVDCEDQIRERRLIAQPWSERCTVCEERHELSIPSGATDFQSNSFFERPGRPA
jgi:RNA polymerase-binding transcription factor DksA